MKPVYLNCQQVFVDFSAAIHLKTIGLQAFFQVRGLGDDPGLTRTTDDVFYIRAKYIDAWTVTFDSNGGTAPAGTDYSPKQVEKGKGTSVPYAPQKKGYYSYWKKADGTGKYYANDYLVPDSDVTLVAQYDPIEYTIKYDPNLPDATGIEYHRIRIATPRHNGKVERQHRTDEFRFYRNMKMYSLEDGRKQLAVYQRESNTHIMTCLEMHSPNQILERYNGIMW